jgi:hypothetical protein
VLICPVTDGEAEANRPVGKGLALARASRPFLLPAKLLWPHLTVEWAGACPLAYSRVFCPERCSFWIWQDLGSVQKAFLVSFWQELASWEKGLSYLEPSSKKEVSVFPHETV